MATSPTMTLNNGVDIPQLGFGVFLVRPDETVGAVTSALKIGYRLIDTAQMYQNEKEVGIAIARSGLQRSEVFLTIKLGNNKLGFDTALFGTDETLVALEIEQIDLFLIHWPVAPPRFDPGLSTGPGSFTTEDLGVSPNWTSFLGERMESWKRSRLDRRGIRLS